MRTLIIRILGTAISFYVTRLMIGGFHLDDTWQAYVIASAVFVVLNWVIGPIIKLLLLPINLLTLGFFRWLTSVIMLYIFDVLYDGITITGYHFDGFRSGILALPPGDVNLFWTLVLSSLVISITYAIFSSLLATE